MAIASINPATGEVLAEFSELSERELESRLANAERAWRGWRLTPVTQRANIVAAAGRILESEKDHFGRLMTLEMGKTLRSAIEEATKCAWACRYYAENAERFVATDSIPIDAESRGEVRYLPLGVVLAVMPWNFPFWQVIRFAAPALVAGNAALLKHASNVPQCALALEDVFLRAGAPNAVFQTLLLGASRVQQLIEDRRVAAVTLTGSEPAGRAVASIAGQVIKKSVLELGGSDPFIVMPSADLERAVQVAVTARTINNGQSCIAAKRFILHAAIADTFERAFVERMRALRIGDPLADTTDIGPLATAAIRDDLDRQVNDSVRDGARLVLGGAPVSGAGNYYAPTVLADPPAGSAAYSEELFGPVATLFRVSDLDAAIALANDTTFGLAASVWTRDESEMERFARDLDVGQVFVNAMVASDPRFPFGGVKASGFGRELGAWGLREFVNVKTVRRFVGKESKKTETE
jgi:succinate-semialdehyde dehydrogenase/glutarate-semialdehyde dehydrogenase